MLERPLSHYWTSPLNAIIRDSNVYVVAQTKSLLFFFSFWICLRETFSFSFSFFLFFLLADQQGGAMPPLCPP